MISHTFIKLFRCIDIEVTEKCWQLLLLRSLIAIGSQVSSLKKDPNLSFAKTFQLLLVRFEELQSSVSMDTILCRSANND